MKTRKIAIIALALVTVLTLGIGYAALNDMLTVAGSAKLSANAAEDSFDGRVYFTGVSSSNCYAQLDDLPENKPDDATITIDTTGEYYNHDFAIVGDTATATFTVRSDADVDVTVVTRTSHDSDHFRVTAQYPDGNVIQKGETIRITVTVTLIKTVSGDVPSESFDISFNAASAG